MHVVKHVACSPFEYNGEQSPLSGEESLDLLFPRYVTLFLSFSRMTLLKSAAAVSSSSSSSSGGGSSSNDDGGGRLCPRLLATGGESPRPPSHGSLILDRALDRGAAFPELGGGVVRLLRNQDGPWHAIAGPARRCGALILPVLRLPARRYVPTLARCYRCLLLAAPASTTLAHPSPPAVARRVLLWKRKKRGGVTSVAINHFWGHF